MNKIVKLYQWTTSIPLLAFILYLSGLLDNNPVFQIIAGVLLMLCVIWMETVLGIIAQLD